MLLSAVITCCMIVANAEPPLNSYSFTSDSNGYDYSNTVANNGYLGSKDSYQNGGSFYGTAEGNHKLSNHVSGHSLINVGNQDNIGQDDVGNSYNGYSNTYENAASESYNTPTRTSIPLRGYIGGNNNDGESSTFTYSSDSVYKDSDFGRYAASSSSSSGKRIPAYPGYSRPTQVSESYPDSSVDIVQGYHGSSGTSSYSESDHIYAPYSSAGLTSEYSFGKQKNDRLNLKGGNKYNGVYSIPSETRYTRGNAGHVSYNRDLPTSFLTSSVMSGLSSHFPKTRGIYSSGKPSKYSYKSSYRYAPNSDVTYMSRERDNYYGPYGKGGGKVLIIKDSPSYAGRVYSDESLYAASNSGHRSKSDYATGYSVSPNFHGFTGGSSSSNYDNSPTILRRYKTSAGPMMLMQKSYYA